VTGGRHEPLSAFGGLGEPLARRSVYEGGNREGALSPGLSWARSDSAAGG